MDETVLELYRGIEFCADSTLLNYACQIELGTSSEREWQIVQLLVEIEILPLPYFTAYKRFYNYIANTTEWNLKPLKDKLANTEYYHNVLRGMDSQLENPTYKQLLDFQNFVQADFAETTCPIDNLELVQFAKPQHQISLDIVTCRDFVHGTKQLKESFMNKVRSLQNIGWKHLAFDEEEMRTHRVVDIIRNVQEVEEGYVEDQ